jgi:hypothetical protein
MLVSITLLVDRQYSTTSIQPDLPLVGLFLYPVKRLAADDPLETIKNSDTIALIYQKNSY